MPKPETLTEPQRESVRAYLAELKQAHKTRFIAERIGMNAKNVAMIASGTRPATLGVARALAEFLNVPIGVVLGDVKPIGKLPGYDTAEKYARFLYPKIPEHFWTELRLSVFESPVPLTTINDDELVALLVFLLKARRYGQ